MVNGQGAGSGNDSAFTNVRILDTTPQLDKSFSPTSVPQGGTSALTFTITNTTELAAKNGWSFADALPTGLTVAGPAPTTTCPSGVVSASTGGSTVSVTGDLAAGMSSCTATVNVTSASVATYTNGPANVTVTGLNPPGSTTVAFTPVADLHVTKTAGPNPYVPGPAADLHGHGHQYRPLRRHRGHGVGPAARRPGRQRLHLDLQRPRTGSTCSPSGAGNIADTVTVLSGGQLTYTITGTVPPSVQTALANTATVTPPSDVTDPGCSPSCSATTTTPANPTVGLSVTKTGNPNPYVAGSTLTYTVTVTNTGPSDALGADGLRPAAGGSSRTRVHLDLCAHLGQYLLRIGVGRHRRHRERPGRRAADLHGYRHRPPRYGRPAINTATVTPPPGSTAPTCSPSCSASNSNPAGPAVNMQVTKTAAPDPYVPGQTLTYTVTVSNTGPSDAVGASVSDPLPAPLSGHGLHLDLRRPPPAAPASPRGAATSWTPSTCSPAATSPTPSPAPSPPRSRPPWPTPPPSPPQPGPPTPPAPPTVRPPPPPRRSPTVGLSVDKTASPDPYVPGQTLTYTIIVANSGPSDAVGASVSDPLPPALTGAGFTWTCTPTAGSTCTGVGRRVTSSTPSTSSPAARSPTPSPGPSHPAPPLT